MIVEAVIKLFGSLNFKHNFKDFYFVNFVFALHNPCQTICLHNAHQLLLHATGIWFFFAADFFLFTFKCITTRLETRVSIIPSKKNPAELYFRRIS